MAYRAGGGASNAGPPPAPSDRIEYDDIEVAISALEHYSYCPRQCALIHVEQTFDENLFTLRGSRVHERVDELDQTVRSDVRVVRALPLWSDRLGLRGRADVVEIRRSGPYPVEYKAGRRLPRARHAELQLCAQALCLEEMLDAEVVAGAIYYHAERRRYEVRLDDTLRALTLDAIDAIRQMLRTQRLPPAPNDARCPNCSLMDACLPSVVGERDRMRGLQGALFRPIEAGLEEAEDIEGADRA